MPKGLKPRSRSNEAPSVQNRTGTQRRKGQKQNILLYYHGCCNYFKSLNTGLFLIKVIVWLKENAQHAANIQVNITLRVFIISLVLVLRKKVNGVKNNSNKGKEEP